MLNVDKRLLAFARQLGIKVYTFEEARVLFPEWADTLLDSDLGGYSGQRDAIALNLDHVYGVEEANVTLAHELIHATGHSSRLARPAVVACELREYTTVERLHTEEVGAYLGSAALLQFLGICTTTAYLQIIVGRRHYAMADKRLSEHYAEQAVQFILDQINKAQVA